MQKDKVLDAVKRYQMIQAEIARKTEALDPELPRDVRARRIREIRAVFKDELPIIEKVMDQGKAFFRAQRVANSETMPALFKQAIRQAAQVNPGHMLIAQGFGLLDTDAMLGLIPEMSNSPALLISAWQELKTRTADLPENERITQGRAIQERFDPYAERFLDRAAIGEAARVEYTINQARIEARAISEPAAMLTMGREQEQLAGLIQ